jgi:hypothetical protein
LLPPPSSVGLKGSSKLSKCIPAKAVATTATKTNLYSFKTGNVGAEDELEIMSSHKMRMQSAKKNISPKPFLRKGR